MVREASILRDIYPKFKEELEEEPFVFRIPRSCFIDMKS
jgi:hypothetical protein